MQHKLRYKESDQRELEQHLTNLNVQATASKDVLAVKLCSNNKFLQFLTGVAS